MPLLQGKIYQFPVYEEYHASFISDNWFHLITSYSLLEVVVNALLQGKIYQFLVYGSYHALYMQMTTGITS